jgi:uncharacterized membrane protein YfcA
MALGGVIGALIGSQIVFNIPNVVLKRMFAVFIIIAGINMLYKTRKKPSVEKPAQEQIDQAEEGAEKNGL